MGDTYDVLLDGKLMGWVPKDRIKEMEDKLRILKINPNDDRVPSMTEIVLVPARDMPGF